jgi:hypothetical protein
MIVGNEIGSAGVPEGYWDVRGKFWVRRRIRQGFRVKWCLSIAEFTTRRRICGISLSLHPSQAT